MNISIIVMFIMWDVFLTISTILSDGNLTPVNRVVVTPSEPIQTQLKSTDNQWNCRTVWNERWVSQSAAFAPS